jgi:hypothetical protein
MIIKLHIINDAKIILNKFNIIKKDNYIEIINIDINKHNIIKVPIFNKYNGLTYVSLVFPFKLLIINNYIFNPYIIYSSYNFKLLNEYNFFYDLENIINTNYNLSFITFNDLLDNNNFNFINIINKFYLNNLNITNYNLFWFNYLFIKLCIIYFIIKNNSKNIPYFLLKYINNFKYYKYDLFGNIPFTLTKYLNINSNKVLTLNELRINSFYYITIDNKLLKIFVNNINKNIIKINNSKELFFNNYKWYLFNININLNKDSIIYNTFININFSKELLQKLLNINEIESNNILECYNNNYKLNYLISINKELDDITILNSNLYTNDFFKYITNKYSSTVNDNILILSILFNNYNYPLKYNKHKLDTIFDYILYYSLYNYNNILINDILNQEINSIIPSKLKYLYINLLKFMIQIITIENLTTFNQKFYNNYLYKNIIKNFIINTDNISFTYLKTLISDTKLYNILNIIKINLLLMDISIKINWNNLSYKLNYLNVYYKYSNIILINNKLNKYILPTNFDNKIKKIIENPYEMYTFLKKENDFIKWTKFISTKIINLYDIPISLSNEDIINFGKLIYLLFNINEQNIKNASYLLFINFCNTNNKLILYNNRINLKIKTFFNNLKININLGYLAKHLTLTRNIITFDNIKLLDYNETFDINCKKMVELEKQLNNIKQKYKKYKLKYFSTKSNNLNDYIYLKYSDSSHDS